MAVFLDSLKKFGKRKGPNSFLLVYQEAETLHKNKEVCFVGHPDKYDQYSESPCNLHLVLLLFRDQFVQKISNL